ncbi:hypothetical protein [Sphaerisporangium sp. NPDC051011]
MEHRRALDHTPPLTCGKARLLPIEDQIEQTACEIRAKYVRS